MAERCCCPNEHGAASCNLPSVGTPGILPTVPCSRTIRGVAVGRDEQLERALGRSHLQIEILKNVLGK